MSDSLLRLAEELLRLGDRLVDNPIIELSASLYFAYIQRVMSKTGRYGRFFHVHTTILKQQSIAHFYHFRYV